MPNDIKALTARRPFSARTRVALLVLAAGLGLTSGSGCGFVPTNRLNDSQKLSQSLQAETSKLKDAIVQLRAQNQELARRSGDDLRTIQDQAETIKRLETSIVAYQKDREQMALELDQIRQGVRAASSSPSPSIEQADPGAGLKIAVNDRESRSNQRSRTIQIPLDRLVKGGTVTPRGRIELQNLLQSLPTHRDRAGSAAAMIDVWITTVAASPEVRPVSLELERSMTDAAEVIREELMRLRGDRSVRFRLGSFDDGSANGSPSDSPSGDEPPMIVFRVSESR